jgi:hypothetical protein
VARIQKHVIAKGATTYVATLSLISRADPKSGNATHRYTPPRPQPATGALVEFGDQVGDRTLQLGLGHRGG